MWIVAGLGNPDPEDVGTRHNVGFAVADLLVARLGARFRSAADGAAVARGRLGGTTVLVLKPLTYMNRSGGPVAAWLRAADAGAPTLIVAHDDADLALGRVQVRVGGGTAGHRGIASVAEVLGTPGFVRVRIGIGRPAERDAMVAHVLGSPAEAEAAALAAATARAADAIEAILTRGIPAAMNVYNAWPPAGAPGSTAEREAASDTGRGAGVEKEVSARARV